MTNFDENDPRWTAYALGELSDEEASELQHDEASRAFVDELRALSGQLEGELAAEPAIALSDAQRQSLEDKMTSERAPAAKVLRWPLRLATVGGGFAAAASVVFIVSQGALLTTDEAPPVVALPVTTTPPMVLSSTKNDATVVQGVAKLALEDNKNRIAHGDRNGLGNVPVDSPDLGLFRSLGADPNIDKYEPLDPGKLTAAEGEHLRDHRVRQAAIARYYGEDAAEKYASDYGLPDDDGRRDRYELPAENPWTRADVQALSTFSVDVDTASYSNVRRYLEAGQIPPKDAVRIEELINYFDYRYAPPAGEHPFAVHTELVKSPWDRERRMLRVGIKGQVFDDDERPASNLVFLLDVSGSMSGPTRLGLVKEGLMMLTEGLDDRDRVSIVVYAGASGLVLPPTRGDNQAAIKSALARLSAGGSTNGGAGIDLAYKVAQRNFIKGGTNRVILATDGDFNVGVTGKGSLVDMAAAKAKKGVFLTVLGMGSGNLNDAMLEQIANKANGQYAVIDTRAEAKKVFVEELGATLHTIAKDVKIQVEFNPAAVAGYRLIGYENRMLAAKDFNDDTKDAGEIGAGHTVTALYEIVPAGSSVPGTVDPLRYQKPTEEKSSWSGGDADELCFLKVRYKRPDGNKSVLMTTPVPNAPLDLDEASADLKFATSVAAFGMLLRGSSNAANLGWGDVLEWADAGVRSSDEHGHRKAFVELVRKARAIKR